MGDVRFNEWQAVDGTPVLRYEAGELQVWDGSAWVKAGGNAFGGNEVKEIGSYRYYVFTNSGNLLVTAPVSCEILAVGGGAGGGQQRGGGGGAGAIEGSSFFTSYDLSAQSYTVTIGAGGIGTPDGVSAVGGDGGDTSITGTDVSLTANGGGGGGDGQSFGGPKDGNPGGSGGGGAGENTTGGTGGSASGSNTNAGGDGQGGGLRTGGGGGGATSAGATGAASGNGGEGKTLTDIDSNLTSANFSTLSGMTVIASGGGGGSQYASPAGSGGTGAGDGGILDTAGGNATSYGSGGGGAGFGLGSGGDGKDGLLIVRIAI